MGLALLILAFVAIYLAVESKYWAKSVKFSGFPVEFAVPEGWRIIDPSYIRTDVLDDPVQVQADDLIASGLDRCCIMQRRGSGTVRPTICVIPGEGFIRGALLNCGLAAGGEVPRAFSPPKWPARQSLPTCSRNCRVTWWSRTRISASTGL